MTSEKLRQLAVLLRKEAAAVEATKLIKCGQVLQAACALSLLQEKVRYVR
jgi:hypothetical protein